MGASGDLAPLSHLALGLMGEGKMWSPKSGWADAKYVRSKYSDSVPVFTKLNDKSIKKYICFSQQSV